MKIESVISQEDFTSCMEFMSLLDYLEAWVNMHDRSKPAEAPLTALSKARTVLDQCVIKSTTIARVMRNEWYYARHTVTALASTVICSPSSSISMNEIHSRLIRRPNLGLLLDLDNRLARSALALHKATEIISRSGSARCCEHRQAKIFLRRADSLLSLDFDQMLERVAAVSEKLIMSTQRRRDYVQSRVRYWDIVFPLQRKLSIQLKALLEKREKEFRTENIEEDCDEIISTANRVVIADFEGAKQHLAFHFPQIV